MGVSTAHKHVHSQDVPAATWNVVHNLNTLAPIVDVFIETGAGLQKVLPMDITVTNAMSLEITFSSDRTGKVSVI